MSLTLHTIDLTVTLAAPYLVYGSDPGCLGLDAILLRNRSSGTPILPGTLVAGRIADAWNELIAFGANAPVGAIEIPPPTRWFGATAEPGSFAPNPSRLLVDDLFCLTEAAADKPHAHRVEICDETGAAKTGSLLLAEQAHAAGTEVEFKGRWRAWLTPGEAGALRQQLLAGLLWQSQIGAQRSVGFGEMLNARC